MPKNDQGNTPSAPSESFADLKATIVEERQADQEPEKKRRGRPPGSKNKQAADAMPVQAPVDVIAPEVVIDAVGLIFDLVAKRRGLHWRLDDIEKTAIGKLASRVITKRAPSALAQYGDEISLGFILVSVVYSRMMIDKQNAEPQETGTEQPVQ